MSTRSTSLRVTHRALAALLLAAGTGAVMAQEVAWDPVQAPTASSLSRTEVRADLAVWRQAGFTGSEADLNATPEQQQRLAEYQQLRSGPAFAAAVERLQQQDAARATRTASHGSVNDTH
jgi:hypothetical protein